ncbi:MAG: helix-turn-helix domain-containing protein [Ignavibacteriales bacterium]|nr:helix-turn-helix domain-containing protein [Ignavibacteriales bacterium]
MPGDWITIEEAAQLSNYHPDYIRKRVRTGRIKGRKVVIVWLVNRTSLMAYLREQEKRGERRGRKPLT